MTAAKTPTIPDYTLDSGSAYPLNIDAGLVANSIISNQFQPHETLTGSPLAQDMSITIEAGTIFTGTTYITKAQQVTSLSPADFIAPVTNPRVDRVAIDITTGTYVVITGTEGASPAAPAYSPNHYPICQINFSTVSPVITQITNDMITDERSLIQGPIFEQGTWTPTIQDDSLSDAEGQTYSIQYGSYTRIGNRIFITGYIGLASAGTLTGTNTVNIAGLPYTSNSTSGSHGAVTIATLGGMSSTAGYNVNGRIDPNRNYITLYRWDTSTGVTGCTITEFGISYASFHGQYII